MSEDIWRWAVPYLVCCRCNFTLSYVQYNYAFLRYSDDYMITGDPGVWGNIVSSYDSCFCGTDVIEYIFLFVLEKTYGKRLLIEEIINQWEDRTMRGAYDGMYHIEQLKDFQLISFTKHVQWNQVMTLYENYEETGFKIYKDEKSYHKPDPLGHAWSW